MTVTTANSVDSWGRCSRRLTGDEKHAPSAHSTLDVLWVLYDRVLRISPDDRRRAGPRPVPALQGARAGRLLRGAGRQGLLPGGVAGRRSAAWTARSASTRTALLIPGVEIGTGSLGHGLGLAVGTALGLRAQG